MAAFWLVFVFAWDYVENGRNWDGLCRIGAAQSPIDFNSYLAGNVSDSSDEYFFVEFDYKETVIVNSNSSSLSGFNYSPKKNFHIFSNFGDIKLGSDTYQSQYLKFHSPSEHTINEISYPLELQIIHKKSNETLVIVILYNYSKDGNNFLQDIISAYSQIIGGKVKLQDAIGGWFAIKDFWYYQGSLSEPPCYESVTYIVNEKIIPATIDQISFFKDILSGNTRETMPQNSRPVQLFKGLKDKVGFSQKTAALFIFYLVF